LDKTVEPKVFSRLDGLSKQQPPHERLTLRKPPTIKRSGGTMKIVVLGATGGTGLEIVRRALEQGHTVTAFVRSPERLNPFRDDITIRQGDLLDYTQLAEAIRGHDAVLSGFGPRLPIAKSDRNLLYRFALSLTRAMQASGVKRAVVISTAFLFKDALVPYLFGRLFFPGVVTDATAMEHELRQSNLDWTIVRPPELTNKRYTGKYRVREGHLPRFGFRISRADVADFFVRSIEDASAIQKTFGVSN
jgi:putative NADH-flavin reductase